MLTSESEVNAFDEMMEGHQKDAVFEQIWLTSNFVTGYCNDF